MVLALLAYPDSELKRRRLESNLNELTLAASNELQSGDALPVLDGHEFQPPDPSVRDQVNIKRTWNRLDQRLRVAQMFRPFVKEWLRGDLPELPQGLRRYSINELSRYVTSQDEDEAHNFEKRWFRSTLPVLHLAIAFDFVSTMRFEGEQEIRLNVHNPDLILEIVLWSVLLEHFVVNNELYSVAPAELIRLRPDP
jgi:hypothetical protein